MKSRVDKASPYFKPIWTRKLSDKYLPVDTLYIYISFKHIFIRLINFMGIPNSTRILYNTSLLNES
jgi:hypothetical protein